MVYVGLSFVTARTGISAVLSWWLGRKEQKDNTIDRIISFSCVISVMFCRVAFISAF